MNRWNARKSEQQQSLDFDQLLTTKPTALQLLAHPNIVEEVKSKSTKFTKILMHPSRRALLYELIDVALTPRAFMQTHQATLDRQATHAAIEILSSLSQEFIEEIFDASQEEDAVVQGEREYPILGQLLRVVVAPQAEETALAYFNKLVTPFIYQRSEQMMRLVPIILPPLLNHFANPSIAEIISKLLEAENQKEFFEEEKVSLVGRLCAGLAGETDEERVAQSAQSLAGFIEGLVEKHEDKYEKAKYSRLIRSILDRSHTFLFLFTIFDAHLTRRETRLHLLKAIQAFLRIHLPSKQNSKLSQEQNSGQGIPLQGAFAEGLKQWLSSHLVHQFVSDSRLELMAYYRVVKTAIKVQPSLIQPVLTQSFLAETLRLMQEDPNNNILHNYMRKVLLNGMKQSVEVCRLLQEEVGIEQLLRSTISDRNSISCLANQIFLIAQALQKCSNESELLTSGWSELGSSLSNKRKFYQAIIGGNPRGEDKWDSMDNDNQMILRSLNQKDFQGQKPPQEEKGEGQEDKKIMIVLANGLEDLGGTQVLSEEQDDPFAPTATVGPNNKHFFDFQLPLDSDKEQSDPQNQSNSLDDIPIVIRIQSNQEALRLSNGLHGSSNASEGMRKSSEHVSSLQPVAQDPLIEQTTQIVIEESFKEEQPSPRVGYYYHKEEIAALLLSKYGVGLQPVQQAVRKEEIERSLWAKYGVALYPPVPSGPHTPFREEMATLLQCKYGVQ